MSVSDRDPESGAIPAAFGRYELLQLLGAGGMAEVYLAREPLPGGMGKILVIKKIHQGYARTRSFQEMFENEARIAVNLNHPCVVHTFGYGKQDETLYLAMEHVDGVDLLRLLQAVRARRQPIPQLLAAYILSQVCKGLDYAHRKRDEAGELLSIVHRDVSPQNVLLSWDGAVKLADFGIARAASMQDEEGVLRGKYAYMSPEQALGQKVDPRSDIFSAGIVLWETATGQPLYGALPTPEALSRIRSGTVPSPRSANPEVPPSLEAIILRALSFHREDRYQTARDLQHDLTRFYFSGSARTAEVIDSARLAAFLAQVLPRQSQKDPASRRDQVPPSEKLRPMPTLAERHNVVVVVGQVVGLPPLPRQGTQHGRLADAFLRVAENVAYKHRAYVHRLDAQGLTCVIGMPHEDENDARHAIQLALAEIEATSGLHLEGRPEGREDREEWEGAPLLQLCVGVQRGLAFFPAQQTHLPDDRTFSYKLEDATLLAAYKLSRAARPGEVLVGGSVYRACRGPWRFAPLPPLEHPSLPARTDSTEQGPPPQGSQKGLQGPSAGRARAYRLLGARSVGDAPSAPPPRLSRRDELDLLHRVLAEAREAREDPGPRHVLLLGERGIGKKSLLSSFHKSLDPAGHLWLSAAARSESWHLPYALLGGLARDLLGVGEHADQGEIRRHLDAAAEVLRRDESPGMEGRVARSLHALGLLLSAAPAAAPAVYVEALGELLAVLRGGRSLLLAIEDLHFADGASLEVLNGLGQLRGPPAQATICLYTARAEVDWPEPPCPAAARILRDPRTLQVRLPGLHRAEQEQLVLSRFAPQAREEALPLCQQISDQAGGNPLYLLEILDALLERGVLRQSGEGLFWADRSAAILVPTTVEALVSARLRRLSDGERQCLQLLSLSLHRRPGPAVLAPRQIAALLSRDPLGDLHSLWQRGLLERTGPPEDGAYRVRSGVVADVVQALLSEEERRELQQRVRRI